MVANGSDLSEITTIQLRKETKLALGEVGTANESYEDVIKKLIEFYRTHKDK